MKRFSSCMALVVLVCAATAHARKPAPPPPPPNYEVIDPKVVNEDGMRISYRGQPAKEGVLLLTASNGFFDNGFAAAGRTDDLAVREQDQGFIKASYTRLVAGRGTQCTARWYLWCPKAGNIDLDFHYQSSETVEHPWRLTVGDQSREFTTAGAEESVAKVPLSFAVTTPGEVQVTLEMLGDVRRGVSIHGLKLSGSAITEAKLLRVRYRPSAVHAKFRPPEGCTKSIMWVFESQAGSNVSSFSPMTTPFGYFGAKFSQGRASGTVNFSVWPNGSQLIATGYPSGGFGGFNHEGSGVKMRGGQPFGHYEEKPERVIQALRVEGTGQYVTYYGYLFDEVQDRWRLYASVQVPRKKQKTWGMEAGIGWAGSFCEIPGAPNRQRSGDKLRVIKRRGWFYSGETEKFYQVRRAGGERTIQWVDSPEDLPELTHQTAGRNKYVTFDDAGWCVLSTGGIECFSHTDLRVKGVSKADTSSSQARHPVPHYLSPEKVSQLFELPVEFGEAAVADVASQQQEATITYDLKKLGPNARAKLFYGTKDAGTTARDEEINAMGAFKSGVVTPDQALWESVTEEAVRVGENRFHLTGLKRDTTYYYRLFVIHDQGKSWAFQSGSFSTQ